MKIATQTLAAIDAAIEADGGNSFRQWLGRVLPHITDAYRVEDAPFRSHMGASQIGDECARKIWYNFRWATLPNFSGRMLRLFNRGHLEEGRFIAMLLMIGVQVYQQDENGKQFRITDHHGHFGGSGDGVAVGVPDLEPGQPCLLEFKTHNSKSFSKLVADGVREAKPEHFTQMNMYMRKMGLPIALYAAVNKDDDQLHMELVHLQPELADFQSEKAGRLIFMESPPPRISNTASYYKCRFCDHRPVCFNIAEPARNCRTCEHAIPSNAGNGQWVCALTAQQGGNAFVIGKQLMLTGCPSYVKSRAF